MHSDVLGNLIGVGPRIHVAEQTLTGVVGGLPMERPAYGHRYMSECVNVVMREEAKSLSKSEDGGQGAEL